ncbi:MAG: hypothetical protein RI911_41 [Candidatus Parcubacteria bacterium]|jgi:cytidyltransferase-like protein
MTRATNRILIFGTFDGIHEGHRDFFMQARKLAEDPHLIVSIARDVNVTRIKGRPPHETEDMRLSALQKEPLVDEVTKGTVDGDYIAHIIQLNPGIIALGYDQSNEYADNLGDKLRARGVHIKIVRCEPYHPEVYKSSKIKRS